MQISHEYHGVNMDLMTARIFGLLWEWSDVVCVSWEFLGT